jgi:hypothetical protein
VEIVDQTANSKNLVIYMYAWVGHATVCLFPKEFLRSKFSEVSSVKRVLLNEFSKEGSPKRVLQSEFSEASSLKQVL